MLEAPVDRVDLLGVELWEVLGRLFFETVFGVCGRFRHPKCQEIAGSGYALRPQEARIVAFGEGCLRISSV